MTLGLFTVHVDGRANLGGGGRGGRTTTTENSCSCLVKQTTKRKVLRSEIARTEARTLSRNVSHVYARQKRRRHSKRRRSVISQSRARAHTHGVAKLPLMTLKSNTNIC